MVQVEMSQQSRMWQADYFVSIYKGIRVSGSRTKCGMHLGPNSSHDLRYFSQSRRASVLARARKKLGAD